MICSSILPVNALIGSATRPMPAVIRSSIAEIGSTLDPGIASGQPVVISIVFGRQIAH